MMKLRHLKAIIAAGTACAAGAAVGGVTLAQASSSHAAAARGKTLCVKYDADDPRAACFGLGPRGFRGDRGRRGRVGKPGATGATGVIGSTGPLGPTGPTGPTGQKGATGDQGIQGIVGNTGAFGNGSGGFTGHTVLVLGSRDFLPSNGQLTGTEIQPPVVARCPVGGQNTEAYDGGVTVTPSGANDVVTLESSFPGIFVSPTEVDPLPSGSTPGAVSAQPANAYEAEPVITRLDTNDTVTVQAYVVCGP